MSRGTRRENISDRIARNLLMVVFTVLLVLGLAMFVSGTVLSQSEEKLAIDEAGLRVLEREYVQEIREYLDSQGFQDSGVTLTWVMKEDGTRSYEVALYHKNMNKLSDEAREELYRMVEALAFEVKGCYFQVNLLV
ncbi:MAG: hypothetical protein IJX63_12740 [Lachnospiraceae bacterium]|nr:hypothetical protein [Lachnospiraceae bacterium]